MNGRIVKLFLAALLTLLGPVAHASGTVTYVYTDPQGTPLAEADASGTITATFDYKPYGSQVLGSPKAGPGYTGHVNDPDTGFVYMQARYYDPVVGRFFSLDPNNPDLGNFFNFNRYVYANDNSVNKLDPNGRQTADDFRKLDQCPPGTCTLTIMDGHWQVVGAQSAQFVSMAQDAGSSASDYTSPSPIRTEQNAQKMDNIAFGALGAGVAGSSNPLIAGVAGVIDEAASISAFVMSPTPERALNVATLGIAKALKVAWKGDEKALKTIETVEKFKDRIDLAKEASERIEEKNREESK